MMEWTLEMFGWILCGIPTYGISLGYFQREFPTIAEKGYRGNCGFALLIAIFGPIGLIVSFLSSGFAKHGLMWRCDK